MKIVIMVEGATEKVFIPHLREFLRTKLGGRMPKLMPRKYDGRIPTKEKLKEDVEMYLSGKKAADYVIALTDVYTGSDSHEFKDAADAKNKMRMWVKSDPRFFPHAAQHEFEAWLLPYWDSIRRLAGHNMACPGNNPETVNHGKPPSHWIDEIFRKGKRMSYSKSRDAKAILDKNNLLLAINSCAELKSLVDTILSLCKV